ncbi:MAG: methionyl-tRNA formyltransferase [Mycoplasmataceae bacterium]|jgi:methionyl-tRNA formyltransferase|nr:methionyl-tRNA formyltransferase [Mycoplasmataceae bacterium]
MPANKIIFFGTPTIAKMILKTLVELKYDVVAVVTQPDRPGNRNKIFYSPVKQYAIEQQLKYFQPEKVSSINAELAKFDADLILTCAYGLLIPDSTLKIPRYHALNIHPSLLPKYRGPSPINFAIFNNDKITGTTLMLMTKELDAGNIVAQVDVKIDPRETYSSLIDKLTNASIELIKKNIPKLFSDQLISQPQNAKLATFTTKIDAQIQKINWHQSAIKIDALIRGLYDQYPAFSIYEGMQIKILHAEVATISPTNLPDGSIINIGRVGILVKTADGGILITELQLPSKRPVLVKDLLNGRHCFKEQTQFN